MCVRESERETVGERERERERETLREGERERERGGWGGVWKQKETAR